MTIRSARFHIGDIVSICNGRLVSLTSTPPQFDDGRKVIRSCEFHGVVNLLEHISGVDLWIPNTKQANWEKIAVVEDPVTDHLKKQFPWVTHFKIEESDNLGSETGRERMFKKEAKRLGIDEWQEVKSLPSPIIILNQTPNRWEPGLN